METKIDVDFILSKLNANFTSFEIIDVEVEKLGQDFILRIIIDNETSDITLDEITLHTNPISDYLDTFLNIKDGYYLEVCSQGTEKKIKVSEINKYIGEFVELSLYQKVSNQKIFRGTILKVENEDLTLEYEDKNIKKIVDIKLSLISKAKITINF